MSKRPIPFKAAKRAAKAKAAAVAAPASTAPAPLPPNVRCHAILISLIIEELNDHGQPVAERQTQPIKLFRAAHPDVWAQIDRDLEQAQRPAPAGPVTPPPNA